MPDAHADKVSLVVYHTGAEIADGWQPVVADSLGGHKSSTLAKSLSWQRYSPINGVRLTHVEGYHGEGSGTLQAVTVDTLRWKPPGQTTWSATVNVPYGEERVIPWASLSGNYLKTIKVKRVLEVDLVGEETVYLRDTFNTVMVGDDFISEDIGYTYSAVGLYNAGSVQATSIELMIPDADGMRDWLRFSTEAPSGGVIQTIADQFTEPTGASWTYYKAGVTVAAGAWLGLWIRRQFTADVSAYKRAGIRVAYTSGVANNLHCDLRGLVRRGKASRREYQLFVGQDAEPDFDSPPQDTAAVQADLAYALAPDHTYYHETLYRNAYDLVAPPQQTTRLIIDAEGVVVMNPPSGPSDVKLLAQSDGTILVTAHYLKSLDAAAEQANRWAIFLTADGTDPDPDIDEPVVETMCSSGVLEYTTSAHMDETPIRCIVRTRRDDGENPASDSENATIYTATTTYWWANLPAPDLAIGRTYGAYAAITEVTSPVYIDEERNVRWVVTGHSVELWADTVLVWTLYENDWKPEFSVLLGDVSDPGVGTVEIGIWDAVAKEIFVNVNGTRRLRVDAVAETITLNSMDTVEAVHASSAAAPIWGCYADTCFQFYDAATGVWSTKMSLNSSGVLVLGVNFDFV